MNINQFTQKSAAALQQAQAIAVEYGHMQVDREHLALALLQEEQGLIPQLLTQCGMSVSSITARIT